MGKDHDYWHTEAANFFAEHFPGVERQGPLSFFRVALPIADKAAIKNCVDFFKASRDGIEMEEDGKNEFFKLDM